MSAQPLARTKRQSLTLPPRPRPLKLAPAEGGHCTQLQHEAVKADPAQWEALPFAGYQTAGPGSRAIYELRTCNRPGCGGTLAIGLEIERARRVS